MTEPSDPTGASSGRDPADDAQPGAHRTTVAREHHVQVVDLVETMVRRELPHRPPAKALAAAAGVSIADLNWAFRIVRSTTVYTALLWVRLAEADRLLTTEPALPPEAVAVRCGFGHYGVFHRSYRLRFGREPRPPPDASLA